MLRTRIMVVFSLSISTLFWFKNLSFSPNWKASDVRNDFPVNRDPCFAHRILGSPGGKHCESLQRNVWRGVVSPLKAVSLDIECRILPWFYEKRRWLMLVRWNFKFLCDIMRQILSINTRCVRLSVKFMFTEFTQRWSTRRQDAVWAYIWACSYYGYDTLNMPYCS